MKEIFPNPELDRIQRAYARRTRTYNPLTPWVYLSRQERERALIRWIHFAHLEPINNKRLVELGCGTGGNLIEFLRLGFLPYNLVGNDLLAERIKIASEMLPNAVTLLEGDASEVKLREESYDVVFQSMMCSSILDDALLERITRRMWLLAKQGGGILWYDFIYNNPKNQDVRGIPLRKIRFLFKESKIKYHKVTLAPPISRMVTRIHPIFYSIFNIIPLFRTHVLCWIEKP